MNPDRHFPLIEALKNPAVYDHPVEKVELVETHISWVLLTGTYAYKIKKPVNLGFVDFSTLEKRRVCCQEELRLNRRLAPSIYLDLVEITGTDHHPEFKGSGPLIEYAVKMKQFDRNQELDRISARGGLLPEHLDVLAKELVEFYQGAEIAGAETPFGTPERLAQPMRDNFTRIHEMVRNRNELERIEGIRSWMESMLSAHRTDFISRKQKGFVRECHGDLHLANMVLIDGRIVVFDCLEFNESLRFIDIISDLAFLLMDLDDRGYPQLACRFLNVYLEASGDYAGLRVLRTYQAYRAMVRAKVAAIRLNQQDMESGEEKDLWQEHRSYIRLAEKYTHPGRVFLVITHGLSGAGKTTLTRPLIENLGAIRVRSDVERKRLTGLSLSAKTAGGFETGIYAPDLTRRLYDHLSVLSYDILKTGYPVFVDATFLKRALRQLFHHLARHINVPFAILDFQASHEVLRKRIFERIEQGVDASEADPEVLDRQAATAEPLTPEENAYAVKIDSDFPLDLPRVMADLERLIN
ncbi:MAG: bifunctional aminoglycoside phosphotransferase/ATP-binding protein [Nitrospiria bacterium]